VSRLLKHTEHVLHSTPALSLRDGRHASGAAVHGSQVRCQANLHPPCWRTKKFEAAQHVSELHSNINGLKSDGML